MPIGYYIYLILNRMMPLRDSSLEMLEHTTEIELDDACIKVPDYKTYRTNQWQIRLQQS